MANSKIVKCKILHVGQNEDEEYMKQNYPEACKFVKKWKSKYNWDGKLSVPSMSKLLLNLAHHDQLKNKTKANPGRQTLAARVWMEEAKTRARQNSEKTKTLLVSRKDDDDGTNTSVRRVQPPQPQPQQAPLLQQDQNIQDDVGAHVSDTETPTPRKNNPFTNPPLYNATAPRLYPPLPVTPQAQTHAEESSSSPSTPVAKRTRSRTQQSTMEDMIESFKSISGSPKPIPSPNAPGTSAFPMIPLPDPHRAGEIQYVHRTWTMDDVKKVVEGIKARIRCRAVYTRHRISPRCLQIKWS